MNGNVHVTGDLDVGGNILRGGNGALTVLTQQRAVKNGRRDIGPDVDGRENPAEWVYDHTGLITERLGAFVILNGFTIFHGYEGSTNWENKGFSHNMGLTAIPQSRTTDHRPDGSEPRLRRGLHLRVVCW